MTLSEVIDALSDIAEQLADISIHTGLDVGQRAMVVQAEVRLAQVHHELVDFDYAMSERIDLEEAAGEL